ncbi:hypothetical protein [Janthinobacterium psychrotolerans]|uniref:LTXXQ motif family protein n=1 Tax=Janthinobacterium psychrotolerans TaxID=1747903 RepID=A0A1A7C3X1_9BURK|nr:hypothetical protein [Janthinobacterium psychrotolerans]OBV39420.1 hypothetical protein ASR47_10109 [Janthinobacterium psychrotolerans]
MSTLTSLMNLPALRLCAALVLGMAGASASAVPIAEMRLQDLLPMAPDFKAELKLNANQQILWQQVESKTRQLLRERQSRRERLQAGVRQALAAPSVELRELVAGMDNESTVSLAEEKQLRDWWLSVNDALDERQRQAVAVFIAGQMARVMDAAAPHAEPRAREGGEPGGRKGGGKGGMGASVGSGGANLNVLGM